MKKVIIALIVGFAWGAGVFVCWDNVGRTFYNRNRVDQELNQTDEVIVGAAARQSKYGWSESHELTNGIYTIELATTRNPVRLASVHFIYNSPCTNRAIVRHIRQGYTNTPLALDYYSGSFTWMVNTDIDGITGDIFQFESTNTVSTPLLTIDWKGAADLTTY